MIYREVIHIPTPSGVKLQVYWNLSQNDYLYNLYLTAWEATFQTLVIFQSQLDIITITSLCIIIFINSSLVEFVAPNSYSCQDNCAVLKMFLKVSWTSILFLSDMIFICLACVQSSILPLLQIVKENETYLCNWSMQRKNSWHNPK